VSRRTGARESDGGASRQVQRALISSMQLAHGLLRRVARPAARLPACAACRGWRLPCGGTARRRAPAMSPMLELGLGSGQHGVPQHHSTPPCLTHSLGCHCVRASPSALTAQASTASPCLSLALVPSARAAAQERLSLAAATSSAALSQLRRCRHGVANVDAGPDLVHRGPQSMPRARA
jgi:hypothetical protein